METKYIYPAYEAGKRLFQRGITGAFVNLNLIKLKDIADYTAHPGIAPRVAVSGYDAFMQYIKLAEPLVQAGGGEILFIGKCDYFLIGPEREKWDICMLIRQKSVAGFFAFEQNPEYMSITGHRLAAIDDARLLPLEEIFPLDWDGHPASHR